MIFYVNLMKWLENRGGLSLAVPLRTKRQGVAQIYDINLVTMGSWCLKK